MAGLEARRGHGSRGLPRRNDVDWPPGQDLNLRKAKGPIDHPTSADRVHAGADDLNQIGLEL
jgi:hypothetical protein